ncbi:MAG: 50S ribosomal protein L20 [Alphaproteobacteria bacterium]
MTHAAYGAGNRRKHKKILSMAKGYRGRAHNCYVVAREKVEKGLQYAYKDRRDKKRTFRALWIQRINAGTRLHDMSYSTFINGLKKANIEMDRKVLANLAMHDAAAFGAIVAQAKAALSK